MIRVLLEVVPCLLGVLFVALVFCCFVVPVVFRFADKWDNTLRRWLK